MSDPKPESFMSRFLELLGAISLLYMLVAWVGEFDISLKGMVILTTAGLSFNAGMYLLEKILNWREIKKNNKIDQ